MTATTYHQRVTKNLNNVQLQAPEKPAEKVIAAADAGPQAVLKPSQGKIESFTFQGY